MDTSEIAKELGRRGGQSTSKKYGKEHFKNMQKLSVASKIAKKRARFTS